MVLPLLEKAVVSPVRQRIIRYFWQPPIRGVAGDIQLEQLVDTLVEAKNRACWRVAPDDVTALLVAVQDEPWFDIWYAALPIAGEREHLVGGTLVDRMVEN